MSIPEIIVEIAWMLSECSGSISPSHTQEVPRLCVVIVVLCWWAPHYIIHLLCPVTESCLSLTQCTNATAKFECTHTSLQYHKQYNSFLLLYIRAASSLLCAWEKHSTRLLQLMSKPKHGGGSGGPVMLMLQTRIEQHKISPHSTPQTPTAKPTRQLPSN